VIDPASTGVSIDARADLPRGACPSRFGPHRASAVPAAVRPNT
jgi:hypothetical protein